MVHLLKRFRKDSNTRTIQIPSMKPLLYVLFALFLLTSASAIITNSDVIDFSEPIGLVVSAINPERSDTSLTEVQDPNSENTQADTEPGQVVQFEDPQERAQPVRISGQSVAVQQPTRQCDTEIEAQPCYDNEPSYKIVTIDPTDLPEVGNAAFIPVETSIGFTDIAANAEIFDDTQAPAALE